NDAPVVHDAVHLTTGNGTLRVPVNATDPDGDALTYTVVENASNGSARLENGTLIYDADSTFEGIDAVTVAVSDGIETTRATIQIAVDRPTLSRLKTRTVSVRPGGAVAVDLLDGGQSNRSIEMVAAPDRGTIDSPSDAGVVEYRPPTNATETWSSVYRVATSEGSEIRIVHFAVVRDDTPPTVRSVAVLNPMPNWINITLETDQALRTATAVVENSSGTIVKRVSLARVTGSPVETAFVYREATALPNGTYRIRVTATDYDGERQTAARTVTIDGSGPRIASSQFDASIESGRTLRISGSANVTGSNVSGVSAWVPGVGMDPVALTQIAPDRWVLNDSAIQITTTAPPRNGMVVIDARGDTGRTIQLATTWYAADRHPSTLSLSATATGDTIRVRVDHSEPLTRLRVRVAGPETRTTETLRYDGTMTALASFENLTSGTYTVAVLDATDHGGNTPADLPTTTVRVGPAEEGPVATSSGGGSLFGSGFDIATPTTTASGGAIRTPVEQTTTTPSTTTTTGFSTAPSTSRETTTTLEVHQKNPSDGSGPGFGAVTALVAVLAAVGLWTRTR
ncbi:MAG: Ig-like domain-containing protein, partial [Halococcoides sp.]